MEQQLDPLQQARMHLAIAASASSIVQTLMRLQGPSAYTSHEQEEARLDLYKRKVAKVESEKWLQEHKPSLTIDVVGANRFISAAIPELRPEQKQALSKAAGKEREQRQQESRHGSSAAAATQFLDSLGGPSLHLQSSLHTGNHPNAGNRSRQAAGAGADKHRWTAGVNRPSSKKERRSLAKGKDRVAQAANAKKRRADQAMLP
ncbi:hypothetical protein CVIRNUC_004096 [Coccomyxa viridis]|uniref:Nuclear nucleic acid-binding protein C1D n=1 Tax=Coccomyxa viridis TaxID=1274662 RepID=A0AAV1I244_9CHLO|nr:hypothetical protein CVIRNUC_004096 [Coccomyxa viridis]